MKVPFIDLVNAQSPYEPDLVRAASEVIRSGVYIGGPAVTNFEQALGAYIQAKAVGVGNGTDALQLALMALGIGPGDEVIVPAFTYAASAEVIMLLGAIPVWCDVFPSTFNIDPDSAAQVRTPKTKAVIAVHLYGQCADLETLEQKLPDLPIIEDTAQALGAQWTQGRYEGRFAGTVGHFGTYSFFPTKPLGGMGDGGALTASNHKLLEKASSIAKHGQEGKYHHVRLGVNSRLDPLQAALLKVKLAHIDQASARRQAHAAHYARELADLHGLELPKTQGSTHQYHQFTLKVADGRRDPLAEFLKSKEIDTATYYPRPLHQQPAYQGYEPRISLRVSEALCQSALSLPIHEGLTQEQIHYVATAIKDFFQS